MQERSNIIGLGLRQSGESGHALIRTACLKELAQLLAALVAENDNGMKQVRPGLAAARILAVAKSACRREGGLATLARFGIVVRQHTLHLGEYGRRNKYEARSNVDVSTRLHIVRRHAFLRRAPAS